VTGVLLKRLSKLNMRIESDRKLGGKNMAQKFIFLKKKKKKVKKAF
jgi:hypothetical protein